jgi:hypothetical protein
MPMVAGNGLALFVLEHLEMAEDTRTSMPSTIPARDTDTLIGLPIQPSVRQFLAKWIWTTCVEIAPAAILIIWRS